MPGNTKTHLWERDKNIKESDDKPTSGQPWNALNTLIETKTLARGIIHDSSDWVNHLTDILKELAKLDIKNQDGSQVPILASDGKTKGLHSLARKLKAKTGKEPYIPKDRIRGTIIVGTDNRDKIKDFAQKCMTKLGFSELAKITDIKYTAKNGKNLDIGDGYFDIKLYFTAHYDTPNAKALRKRELTSFEENLVKKDGTLKSEKYEIIINGYGDFLAKSGLPSFEKIANSLKNENGAAIINKFKQTRPELTANDQRIPTGLGHVAYELTRKQPDIFGDQKLSDMKKWFTDFEKYYYSYFMKGNNGRIFTLKDHITKFKGMYKEAEESYEEAGDSLEKAINSKDLNVIKGFKDVSKT